MTTSFKRFRARGFRDKAIDYDDAVRTTYTRAKHKREGALAEKQNRENTSALLELRDIEDELKTLETLFTTQKTAIKIMIEHYEGPEMRRFTGNALQFLYQANTKLDEYLHHAGKMIKSVQSTRDDVRTILPHFPYLILTKALSSSTNSCKWSNDKPKSTKSVSHASKQTSHPRNPAQS
jgi:hypothetical protein